MKRTIAKLDYAIHRISEILPASEGQVISIPIIPGHVSTPALNADYEKDLTFEVIDFICVFDEHKKLTWALD